MVSRLSSPGFQEPGNNDATIIRVQAQHASPIPIQCADDFSDMSTIPAVDGPVGEEYTHLDKALSDLPLYKAVCLNDLCPDDRYRWKV